MATAGTLTGSRSTTITDSYRILVVEDDEALNHLIQKSLQRKGYATEGVQSGAEALKQVQDSQQTVMILDYQLPDLTGREVIEAMQRKHQTLPFIVITGHGDEKTAVEMMKMGARDYVVKDSSFITLLPIIADRVVGELEKEKKLYAAEAALHKSEERYRHISEAITDYIYTVRIASGRPSGSVHSDACTAITGYSREELEGSPEIWTGMAIEKDRIAAQDQVNQVLRGNVPRPIEYRIKKKGGDIIWVESTLVPACDAAGSITSYDGILRDISERKGLETQLRKLTSAVEQSPVTLVITDTLGCIEYVNPYFTDLTGYSSDEAVGRYPNILKSGFHPPEFYADLWNTISSGNVWRGELYNKKKNGECFWEDAVISPLTNEKGEITHFIAIKEDITERKDLQKQLIQAQKMEAVGQLAGGIAHDFNNILSAIINYTFLLNKKLSGDHEMTELAKNILTLSKRGADITQGLLAFSRNRLTDHAPMNINNAVQDMEMLLKEFIGEDIKLAIDVSKGLPSIMADRSQIEQIIMNLATNARDAMPHGGSILIKTGEAELDSTFARHHGFSRPGRYVFLTVSDTGSGMSATIRNKAYEPFFSTKEVGKGTGLGLSIVYGIIKQHDGNILLQSEQGEGTTFSLYFPAVDAEAAPGDSAKPPTLSGSGQTILVAEDEEQVRTSLTTILEHSGYTVIEAENGREAIAQYEKHKNEIELLLFDVVMPVMNGKTAFSEIRKSDPDIKVIFISGYAPESETIQDAAGKTASCILKPIHPELLLARIHEALIKG